MHVSSSSLHNHTLPSFYSSDIQKYTNSLSASLHDNAQNNQGKGNKVKTLHWKKRLLMPP
jgi:hypothetical protein